MHRTSKDYPTFSQNLLDHLLSFECEEIITGGDFNLVMDGSEE